MWEKSGIVNRFQLINGFIFSLKIDFNRFFWFVSSRCGVVLLLDWHEKVNCEKQIISSFQCQNFPENQLQLKVEQNRLRRWKIVRRVNTQKIIYLSIENPFFIFPQHFGRNRQTNGKLVRGPEKFVMTFGASRKKNMKITKPRAGTFELHPANLQLMLDFAIRSELVDTFICAVIVILRMTISCSADTTLLSCFFSGAYLTISGNSSDGHKMSSGSEDDEQTKTTFYCTKLPK